MDIEIPEIDADKLMLLRKEMLQKQELAQRAQEAAWSAEAAFTSYARYGDLQQAACGVLGGRIANTTTRKMGAAVGCIPTHPGDA